MLILGNYFSLPIFPEMFNIFHFNRTNTTGIAKIYRLNLDTFSWDGTLELYSDAHLTSAVIDEEKGFAYFGTSVTLPRNSIIKVDLNKFKIVDKLTLNADHESLNSASIDPKHGFVYFGTSQAGSSKVIKIRLSDFSLNGTLELYSNLYSVAMDPSMKFTYFGSDDSIVRLDLQTFSELDKIMLYGSKKVSLIDYPTSKAYFASANKIYQVLLYGNLFKTIKIFLICNEIYLKINASTIVVDMEYVIMELVNVILLGQELIVQQVNSNSTPQFCSLARKIMLKYCLNC